MNHLQTYQVLPATPKPLEFLETLSRNMWWCWQTDAIELLRRIDPPLWQASGRNPILFLAAANQERLESLAVDDGFLSHLKRVKTLYNNQILTPVETADSPYDRQEILAYFSMEFGIHESLPLFAGGLGVLAGDHLKAASDMALPMVGVGLMYRCGYFHQYLDPSGWQQEEYPETNLYNLPIKRAKDPNGQDVYITIEGPDGTIRAVVWQLRVGRIPLYLLDTNLPENPPAIRMITERLYAGDQKWRLDQEVLLGIGGMRALSAMNIRPTVCHMNEGHCAFASLERLAITMNDHDLDLSTALEIVPRSNVFTTHTPVAAGHDEFPAEMVKPYLRSFVKRLGLDVEQILAWGQSPDGAPDGPLSMFVLAIRMSQFCNGVSELHGSVARRMWTHVWPNHPEEEVPITHITNGVHIPSYISIENALLFERYLGPNWYLDTLNADMAERINSIYPEELWRAHEMSRSRLIRNCRSLLVKQQRRRNAPKSVIEEAEKALDQEALTIGFARRFATYKRANLLLQDSDRLEAMITAEKFPVQFIFAGKAHPKDNEGKELIKKLIHFSRRTGISHRVIFLEDYDIHIARQLVQGVDVWLNNPRRPFEACGTSGMKAAANGVLNVSILDGWWVEGYSEETGWKIGNGEEYDDWVYQDAVESRALFNLLENDIIPCFYERDNGDAPGRWLSMMKASMKMAMRYFSAHRMVAAYEEMFYLPAADQYHRLLQDNAREARSLFNQRERLNNMWKHIRIEQPQRASEGPFRVGDTFRVNSIVHLGELNPDEVDVELFYGTFKSVEALLAGRTHLMNVEENRGNGTYLYACEIKCNHTGRFGFTSRVTARGDDRIKFSPEFIIWA